MPPTLFAASGDGLLGLGCIAFSVLFGLFFYFVPTLVAIVRGHQNLMPIVVVNLFLGWLLVGWVVALAWAFTAHEEPRYGSRRGRYRPRYRDEYDD